MTGFKKKKISDEQLSAAEQAASTAPIVGDPRIASTPPIAVSTPVDPLALHLASRQVSPISSSNTYESGRIYDVPLGLIKSNPFNPRVFYPASAVDDMAQSLSAGGQNISATGYIDDNGAVVLIEGETRLRGARGAGLPTLRIEIQQRPESDRLLYEKARAANVERRDQTPLDDALKWKDLLSAGLYPSQVGLAKALNLNEAHVSRTLGLAVLPRRVIDTVMELPDLQTLKMLNALREYWEVAGDDKTIELILEIGKSGMGFRDVDARRQAAAKGTVNRTRSIKMPLSFGAGKGELRTFEKDGRIELSLKGLGEEEKKELLAKIMALFEKPKTRASA